MLIVDTGPVVALLNDGDVDHARCTALLAGNADPPLLPVQVLTAVCQLLEVRRSLRAEVAFLADVHAGLFTLVDSSAGDLARIIALIDTNAEPPLGAVHASVIAAAERLAVTTVATLDRRPFTAVQPRHIPAFTLLP